MAYDAAQETVLNDKDPNWRIRNSNCPVVLTINNTGNGTITSTPAGINCGADCTETYAINAVVQLTATAEAGYTFQQWSGDCSGTGTTISVTLDAAKNCTTTFVEVEKDAIALTLTTVGNGTVTCNGGACQTSYPAGATVNLVATPANDFSFTGWTGNCGGTNTTTTVTMTAAKNCTATFEKNLVRLTLTPSPILTKSQRGTTTLNINPTGNCGPISWKAEEPKTGGNITNLLVSPKSGTGNATVTLSYRKSSMVSPKKGHAKVSITAYCDNGTATVTQTAIIR